MRILLTPEDILHLGCWDNYCNFILRSKDPAKVLSDNEEFEIPETDALVIGILNVVPTPHLIHRFNNYTMDILMNKSITNKSLPFIQKKTLTTSIEKFFLKYPEYWKSEGEYTEGLKQVKAYVAELLGEIDALPVTCITNQFGTYEFINSNLVRKALKFNV